MAGYNNELRIKLKQKDKLDFLTTDVNTIYRRYLVPTLGSALAMSIYSVVDSMAVGQYAGPAGSAALAVVNPVYVIMTVIAFLFATGGSVRLGNALGEGDERKAKEYFTLSAILCAAVTCAGWLIFRLWYREIFTFFGATADVLPIAAEYGLWIIRFFPVIVLPDFLAPFLRVDKDPIRAMTAVVTGGGINMFLDWFLVFPVGMGVKGAAIATVIGTAVQCVIMLSHFSTAGNHLRFVRIAKFGDKARFVVLTGFAASLLDLGNVFVAILMNNQIARFGGTAALGVYGVINTLAILFQALFSGVGQTIQPGVSINHGAGNTARSSRFRTLAVRTALGMGIGFCLLGELFPTGIVRIFMKATPEALAVAPQFVRMYFLAFPFLGYTVTAIYYLQSVLRQKASNALAISRSFLLPAVFLTMLPARWKLTGVYAAIPVSEMVVSILALLCLHAERRSRQ